MRSQQSLSTKREPKKKLNRKNSLQQRLNNHLTNHAIYEFRDFSQRLGYERNI